MVACCVSGCKNRYSSTSELKFYRVPSGSRPFQANRRRLWLQAIQRVNGSTEELRGNARICGAHFKSQEASMDHDSPDFVPSVFTCVKQTPRKKVSRIYLGRRKRRRRAAKVDSPVELQSSVLTEEIQTPSTPSKEGETLTQEAETESETTTIKSQTSTLKLHKMRPIVLLKHVIVPAGGYLCEQCNQNFTSVSQLVKHKRLHEEESAFVCEMCGKIFTSQADFTEHRCEPSFPCDTCDLAFTSSHNLNCHKQLHEEESSFICESCGKIFTSQADFTEHRCVQEPSFPCNMCDRSFTTSHNLKRHKLLHVRDGRKCRECGALFCKRHKHVFYVPLAEPTTEYEEDSIDVEPENSGGDWMSENHLLQKPEPSQTAELDGDAQSTVTVSSKPAKPGPLSEAPSAASHTRTSSEIPAPLFLKPSSVSHLPPPVTRISSKPRTSSQFKPPLPSCPAPLFQPPPPQLPPSLKLFSPQYLTSALLQVERNYEYILSKPRAVNKKKIIVKEEPCELPVISPGDLSVDNIKKERTAYDLEIVL